MKADRFFLDVATRIQTQTECIILDECSQDFELSGNTSVAVHLHLFYTDLLPNFIEALSNMPVVFALFVSIPKNTDADEEAIAKSLHQLPRMQRLVIRRTPNRGRDIAPMLCTFANELQQYDLMLHLHSKKSPHDLLQSGWLPFILEHLLPAPSFLKIILHQLENNTGIISPPDYLYYSPDGWGISQNIIWAQWLIDRSDIDINLKKEYPQVDFPKGSMFWARTEFLRRLFNLGLTYEDFPEEPIPNDGTVAHALERLFFIWGDKSMTKKKVYIYKSEIFQIRRLLSLSAKYQYKNEKHLRAIRVLLYVCLILFAVTIVLLFHLFIH